MKNILKPIALIMCFIFTAAVNAQQNKLCIKNNIKASASGKINLAKAIESTTTNCKKGFTEIDVLQGAQGEAGSQGAKGDQGATGPQGAKGEQGEAGNSSFENISIVKVSSQCSAPSYTSNTPVTLCSPGSFTKFENDTILEVIFHGRFARPQNMGNFMSYEIVVDGVSPESTNANSGPGKVIVRANDSLGNSDNSIQATIHGIYSGVTAGQNKALTIRAVGTVGSSGDNPQIDPGNYGSSYAIVREIRLP